MRLSPGQSSSVLALVVAAALPAQELRYEVGRRLRDFERAFAASTDLATRQRVCPHLERTVTSFFSGQLGEVARHLTLARLGLEAEARRSPTAEDGLMVGLGSRLIDLEQPSLAIEVKHLFAVEGSLADGLRLRAALRRADGSHQPLGTELAGHGIPGRGSVDLLGAEEGDHVVVFELMAGDRLLGRHEHGVSLVRAPQARLAALEAALPERRATLEATTLAGLTRTLRTLVRGRTLETDYPAARLFADAEQLARALSRGERFYDRTHTGQHWLTLATRGGAVAARILVPDAAATAERLPLVVALHGAGGSENLFFDGYGAGATVELCRKRGWLLVAPRLAGFGIDIAAMVDALAERYPVDPARVFLVGHSMGAAQAISALGASPRRWAAVAALGGGGSVGRGVRLDGVHCFVGCGQRDFARRGATALSQALAKAGATVEARDYEWVEHLAIVQVALPDVFALFDARVR